jgi:hypothetical protein
MITINDPKTRMLFDIWANLGPKRRQMLDESWSGIFRSKILPILPAEKLISKYKVDFGRPGKELYSSLGVLLLQQMHDLTDSETVEQFSFNIQWHYSLNITNDSDASSYMCEKTLWNFRKVVTDIGIDSELFELITSKLAKEFSVDTGNQRLDSVHIRSNMKNLGRIGLFTTTIRKFLVNLKRHHCDLLKSLPSNLIDTYLSKDPLAVFSKVKPSESKHNLKRVSQDMFEIYKHFAGNESVESMTSYKLLSRVLNDHCNISSKNQEGKEEITVKAAKSISGGSLQNPSDPTAGYNAHKGQGYEGQVMETYTVKDNDHSDNANEKDGVKEKKAELNLITYVNPAPSNCSDADALIPAIKDTKRRELGPDKMLADALYGSDENLKSAKDEGVEVIAPVMGYKEKHDIKLSDFEISEGYKEIICPMGQKAERINLCKDSLHAGFAIVTCRQCARLSDCPVKKGANFYYLRNTYQAFKNSHRRKFENTAKFKERYRMRSGIEGAISELDRRTGIKHLRVRGLAAVRFCMNLKATGLNIFRSSAFVMLLKKQEAQKASNGMVKKSSEKHGEVLLIFICRKIYNICLTILQFRLTHAISL